MTTVRLRFTGDQAVTFQEPGVGSVEPQGEFEVPEDRAETFTRRADIELVSAPKSRRRSGNDQGDTGSAQTGDDGGDLRDRGALTETGQAGDPDPGTLA